MTKVNEVLNRFACLILDNLMFHSESKADCHLMNLQGFKRWHRYAVMNDMKLMEKIKSHIVDYYAVRPEINSTYMHVIPSNLQSHIMKWLDIENNKYNEICGMIKELNEINAFVEAEMLTCINKKIACEIKKVTRLNKQLADTNWAYHEIYTVDRKLHKLYKKKESEKHNYNV